MLIEHINHVSKQLSDLSFQLKEVLVSPKQSIMASENTFHSTSVICKLDEPILQLKKERRAAIHSPEKLIPETILDIPEGERSI
jgi:hypothetical protein